MPNKYSTADFLRLSTPHELAEFLNVQYGKHLVYNLYKLPPQRQYKTFEIKRRNGGKRIIATPRSGLKLMQKKISIILQDIYEPKPSVHGYVNERSIVTNALRHTRSRFVLNTDLESFFQSINFGRVRGMFIARPFSFPSSLATVLAQMCCHNNGLPIGAPTSPVIANFICLRLDRELQKLAASHNCHYTRYADDISFSTRKHRFPKAIGILYESTTQIGSALEAIIHNNGFQVNHKKTRLLRQNVRQEVTGLVVNTSPNLRRSDVRRIRAMLHAWEKHGHDCAEKVYYERYCTKSRFPGKEPPAFEDILRGTIAFFKSVKGEHDPVYIKIVKKFNTLSSKQIKFFNFEDIILIIEDHDTCIQGTGFFLQNRGFITCAHCVGNKPYVYSRMNPDKKFEANIIQKDEDIDLAILAIDKYNIKSELISEQNQSRVNYHDKILLLGYPNFAPGKEISLRKGEVTSFQKKSGVQRFNISANIVAGNSGGPVLNAQRRVVGVAVTGADLEGMAGQTDEHGVIPIGALSYLS